MLSFPVFVSVEVVFVLYIRKVRQSTNRIGCYRYLKIFFFGGMGVVKVFFYQLLSIGDENPYGVCAVAFRDGYFINFLILRYITHSIFHHFLQLSRLSHSSTSVCLIKSFFFHWLSLTWFPSSVFFS